MNKKSNIPQKTGSQGLVKITKTQFLKDFSIPAVQKKCRRVATLQQAISMDMPSLAIINKQFGDDFIQAYIEGWIVNLREFLNIGRKMTDAQTQDTAILIIDQFYNITIADVDLIFKKVKLGHFGQIYDRLDGQVILSWFNDYYGKRCDAFAEKSIQEAEKFKSDPFQRTSEPMSIIEINKKYGK